MTFIHFLPDLWIDFYCVFRLMSSSGLVLDSFILALSFWPFGPCS